MDVLLPWRSWAALACGLAAVAAAGLPISALAAFHLTALALAGSVGAGFAAYMAFVDRPGVVPGAELSLLGLTAIALACDAALRFPEILMRSQPPAAEMLGSVACALCVAAVAVRAVAELASLRARTPSLRAPLRWLLERS
jgi:hypothetical protein